jgi:protein LSM14
VQKSLAELNVDPGRPRRKPQPPAVPDAEFDFSKGNERFQKERQARKAQEDNKEEPSAEDEAVDLGEPENKPHPSAVVSSPDASAQDTSSKPARKAPGYSKSSFFDNISSDSSRVTRAEERHRNLDTFGEAGGDAAQGGYRYGQQGGRGGMGGRGRGRGRGGRPGGFQSTPAWA